METQLLARYQHGNRLYFYSETCVIAKRLPYRHIWLQLQWIATSPNQLRLLKVWNNLEKMAEFRTCLES
jgi:hypothetical protein